MQISQNVPEVAAVPQSMDSTYSSVIGLRAMNFRLLASNTMKHSVERGVWTICAATQPFCR